MKITSLYLRLILLMLFAGIFRQSVGQIIFEKPQSRRITHYTIDAELDPEKKIIQAKMQLLWKNTSSDTISEFRFHAYMNAFANSETTFMKESGLFHAAQGDKSAWGYLQLDRFRIKEGENLIRKYEYISPDDGNPKDRSVFRTDLAEPILPEDTAVFELEYSLKLPHIFARTGYVENFFMVAQWFPKIGVYEDGQWHCHQFHANSEFYADFGVYDVSIRLPDTYNCGAGGVLIESKMNKDGTKTLRYRAEDVIDFAWTAGDRLAVAETEYKGINIRLLTPPERLKNSYRYLESLKIAADYFSEKLGPYPYPELTIVDPPFNAAAAGGMEYPGLITGLSLKYLPKGLRITELVTIHEFGHQYFMGILASDEFTEAWLDEGINSWVESRIMDQAYGSDRSVIDFWGFRLGNADYQRNGYTGSKFADITFINQKSWNFPAGSYFVMNYNKPATFLTGLERMLGKAAADSILKKYYQQFKFKHPAADDFLNIVKNEAAKLKDNIYAEHIDSFFEQFLNSPAVCDFAVRNIKERKSTPSRGYYQKDNQYKNAGDNNNFVTEVILERKGDFILPIEAEMIFNNGDTIHKVWNGKAKLKSFKFEGSARIISAEIDPERKLFFDINHNNNSYTTKPEKTGIRKYVLKVLFWLQNIMQFTTFF